MKSVQYQYTGNRYVDEGGSCTLIQEAFNSVEKACICYDAWENKDCQIQVINKENLTCKSHVSSSCLLAVKNWVEVYSTEIITNGPKLICKDHIATLHESRKYVQELWESCVPG